MREGLDDIMTFLPLTMGACGAMADWESIGGMTGTECKDFHVRKVRTALEGNKKRIDSQYDFWYTEKMLPFALISPKYQSVVAWVILEALQEHVEPPDDAEGMAWLNSNVSAYTKAMMGPYIRELHLDAPDLVADLKRLVAANALPMVPKLDERGVQQTWKDGNL